MLADGTKTTKKAAQNPLFEKRTRTFGIGGDLPPKQDLTRFVKWPEYVRLQRQKVILNQRLKVCLRGSDTITANPSSALPPSPSSLTLLTRTLLPSSSSS